ncbi:hypothetical protein OH77DRAFT_1172282 [Trametes cingulata]|nr:hypothetical protein OH77DRAFT_1172282 [Trametes cingulata]
MSPPLGDNIPRKTCGRGLRYYPLKPEVYRDSLRAHRVRARRSASHAPSAGTGPTNGTNRRMYTRISAPAQHVKEVGDHTALALRVEEMQVAANRLPEWHAVPNVSPTYYIASVSSTSNHSNGSFDLQPSVSPPHPYYPFHFTPTYQPPPFLPPLYEVPPASAFPPSPWRPFYIGRPSEVYDESGTQERANDSNFPADAPNGEAVWPGANIQDLLPQNAAEGGGEPKWSRIPVTLPQTPD